MVETDEDRVCEFCGVYTRIDLDPEEMPRTSTIEYIVEAAPPAAETADDVANIIFCIDISGSMCVTMEVDKNAVIKSE